MPSETSATLLPRVLPPACTGVVLATVVPSPSWPHWLLPQHQRVPSIFRAQLRRVPSEISATALPSALAPACTGVVFEVKVPSPSWPESFAPQHHRVPSVLRAQLCPSPSARSTAALPSVPA